MRYARIQDGTVVEVVEPMFRYEKDRPEAPADLLPGRVLNPAETEQREVQQREHDSYRAGEVPIEERFPSWIVETLFAIPSGLDVQQGWLYAGSTFSPPVDPAPAPVTGAQGVAERDARLLAAVLVAWPLQCAADLGTPTAAQKTRLASWKAYCADLLRVTEQPGFPASITWPTPPASD